MSCFNPVALHQQVRVLHVGSVPFELPSSVVQRVGMRGREEASINRDSKTLIRCQLCGIFSRLDRQQQAELKAQDTLKVICTVLLATL